MESNSSDQIEIEYLEEYFKNCQCFANNDATRIEAARILVGNGIRLVTLNDYDYNESKLRDAGFSLNEWPTLKLQTILNCLNRLRIQDQVLITEPLEETDVRITIKVGGGIKPYDVRLCRRNCRQHIEEGDKDLVEIKDKIDKQDFEFTISNAQITDSGIYFFEIIDSKGNFISSLDFQIYIKPNLNGKRQII